MRLNGFITDQCGAVVIKTRTVIVKINQDVACMQNGPRSRRCGDQHATHGSNSKVFGDDTEQNPGQETLNISVKCIQLSVVFGTQADIKKIQKEQHNISENKKLFVV